jgi:hypothetical protein
MKKLLILLFVFFFSIPLFGHPREKLDPESNFIYAYLRAAKVTMLPEVVVTAYRNPQDTVKKSKVERDDLYYTPSKDIKIQHKKFRPFPDRYLADTLIKDNDTVALNEDDPFDYYNNSFSYSRFFNTFSFNMWYGGFYPYWHGYFGWPYSYGFMDPLWFDFWYDWNYPYFATGWGWFGPYWNWGWNWWGPFWHHPNYWNNPYHRYPYQPGFHGQYARRDGSSNMIQRRIPNAPYSKVGVINQNRRMESPQNRPMYNQNRRDFRPSYNNPRMSERPLYNNTHTYNGRSSNQSRSYSPPTRSYNSSSNMRGNSNYSSHSSYNYGGRSGGSFGGSSMSRSSSNSGGGRRR